jgi:hypothetical protein
MDIATKAENTRGFLFLLRYHMWGILRQNMNYLAIIVSCLDPFVNTISDDTKRWTSISIRGLQDAHFHPTEYATSTQEASETMLCRQVFVCRQGLICQHCLICRHALISCYTSQFQCYKPCKTPNSGPARSPFSCFCFTPPVVAEG